MIKQINPKKLLTTEAYVREPVDNLTKSLMNDNSKKIILTGGRGSGKSTILYNIEHQGIGTDYQSIYMTFDTCPVFPTERIEAFNETFLEHYYELTVSYKLLNYIKTHYSYTYETYFKDIEKQLDEISKETNDYIQNAYWRKPSLNKYLTPTEISSKILLKMKETLNINTINLLIDRFDWPNGNNQCIQQILSKFFNMFNKTIITTDDETYNIPNNQLKLKNEGYTFTTVHYSYNVDIIKHIIKKRILLSYKQQNNEYKQFDENMITDEIYSYLIKKTHGNISLMLNIISHMSNIFQLSCLQPHEMHAITYINTDEQVEKNYTLTKTYKKPKLYL